MQIEPDEARLWEKVLTEHRKRPEGRIRVAELGKQVGIHPQRSRQLARTWKNRGWIDYAISPDRIFILKDQQISDLREQD